MPNHGGARRSSGRVNFDAASQLVLYARQIAVYAEHTNLVNGLQDVKILQKRYEREVEEFKEALVKKTWLHWLHEAADLLYYAAAIREQKKSGKFYSTARREAVQLLRFHGLQATIRLVEQCALAKYAFRASAPGMKDEARELVLIQEAYASE